MKKVSSVSPIVSVVLPVYNGSRYLRAAVDSILRQSFTAFELIIVDDGSTDRTPAILAACSRRDARIHVLRQTNQGIVAALNRGIEQARAPYIARMDADDISAPERLQEQVSFLDAHREINACGTSIWVMDHSGHVVDRMNRPLTAEQIERDLMKGDGGAIIHPTLMVRRTALERVGCYRKFAEFTEDLDLYLRLSFDGPLANLPEPLLRYRVHFQSTNFTKLGQKARVKEAVMRAACLQRSVPFQSSMVDLRYMSKPPLSFHREWAESASRLGHRFAAIKHGLIGAWHAPADRQSYALLKLVLRRTLASFPSASASTS